MYTGVLECVCVYMHVFLVRAHKLAKATVQCGGTHLFFPLC